LVEAAIERTKVSLQRPLKILDVGTGSGNIAISLAKRIPGSQVTTIDISSDALELAAANARENGVASQISFILGDLFSPLPDLETDNHFDVIISNPPYIPTSQINQLPLDVRNEPRLALDGGNDGLNFYRRIISQAPSFLKEDGLIFLEMGDGQKDAIKKIFRTTGCFKNIEFIEDYRQTPRIAIAEVNKNG
jgi:release factor glutamine methyltransferase